MLDKRSLAALKYFVEECSEGSYKILETEDIIAHLPKNFAADEQVVAQIVKYLENGEYISVKYSDSQEYCLCPLPFGRQFVESQSQEVGRKKQNNILAFKTAIASFIASFLGGFLGAFICLLI